MVLRKLKIKSEIHIEPLLHTKQQKLTPGQWKPKYEKAKL